jgi:flavin-dependent dehydrogenase
VSRHFDAIIIGTGQAGPSLAARFAARGPTLPTWTELFTWLTLAFNKSDFRFRRKHRRKERGKSEV